MVERGQINQRSVWLVMVGDQDPPRVRLEQADQVINENGLAATGWADDGDDLSATDLEIDAPEDVVLTEGAVEMLGADFGSDLVVVWLRGVHATSV
jgi:hypothetical protein